MADSRRRSGGGSPLLFGPLGTLLRSTLAQANVVRDAIERGAREGKSKIDDVRRSRRRHDALAELGRLALVQLRAGTPENLDDLPEVLALVDELDLLDDEIDPGAPVDDASPMATMATAAREVMSSLRARFDGREDEAEVEPRPSDDDDDDGTVSSGARYADSGPVATGGIQFDDDDDDLDDDDEADLANHMHPDDVPKSGE